MIVKVRRKISFSDQNLNSYYRALDSCKSLNSLNLIMRYAAYDENISHLDFLCLYERALVLIDRICTVDKTSF